MNPYIRKKCKCKFEKKHLGIIYKGFNTKLGIVWMWFYSNVARLKYDTSNAIISFYWKFLRHMTIFYTIVCFQVCGNSLGPFSVST